MNLHNMRITSTIKYNYTIHLSNIIYNKTICFIIENILMKNILLGALD